MITLGTYSSTYCLAGLPLLCPFFIQFINNNRGQTAYGVPHANRQWALFITIKQPHNLIHYAGMALSSLPLALLMEQVMPLLSAADMARLCISMPGRRDCGQRMPEIATASAAKGRGFECPLPETMMISSDDTAYTSIVLQLLHHHENGGWHGCSRISCSDHSLVLAARRSGRMHKMQMMGFGCRATGQLGTGAEKREIKKSKTRIKSKRGARTTNAMSDCEQREPTPIQVPVVPGKQPQLVSVAAGGGGYRHGTHEQLNKNYGTHDNAGFSFALTCCGQLLSFGSNKHGQLGRVTSTGNGSSTRRRRSSGAGSNATATAAAPQPQLHHLHHAAVPQVVASLRYTVITVVSAGAAHSLMVSAHGQGYSFGAGAGGRLGHGDDEDVLFPRRIMAFATVAEARTETEIAEKDEDNDNSSRIQSSISYRVATVAAGGEHSLFAVAVQHPSQPGEAPAVFACGAGNQVSGLVV